MHLISTTEQTVKVAGQTFRFAAGESIHTENSYKYSADEFIQLAEQAGFISDKVWLDANHLFSVQLFTVKS